MVSGNSLTHSKLFPYKTSVEEERLHKETSKRPENMTKKSWFRYFQYDERKETLADARNVLLVVAGLIAAVTFQAGINPPGGVWQDDKDGHRPGRAIYSYQTKEFYVFLISNTVAFSTSILLLISLTHKFPFHFEVILATTSMVVTYASSVFAVTPDELVKFRYILLAAAAPFIIRFLLQVWARLTMEV